MVGASPNSQPPRSATVRTRRLSAPRIARVHADRDGRPRSIDDRPVEAIRESWLVEDRWWTDTPLRRRYWEAITTDGDDVTVFRDLLAGRWYRQR